jgi:hypothetical protein
MKKSILFILVLAFSVILFGSATAQQTQSAPAAPPQTPKPAPQVDRSKLPLAQRGNLSLADVNTHIGVDKRVIVMMAALNVAGYDYEAGSRQLSTLRQQLRADLPSVNPELVAKLRAHFQTHRKGRTDAAAVAPYLSLALTLTEPPAFLVDVPAERLPDDVREITDFAVLLDEFYRATNFSRLLPKYVAAYLKAAESYPQAAGQALGAVLVYLHTEPILELPPLFIPRRTAAPAKEKKDKKAEAGKPEEDDPLKVPNRVRQFVIMPDLLNAAGAANLRIVRDTYFLLLGPSAEPSVEAIRRAFLGFVIDPLTERQVKEVAAMRGELRKLMESRGPKLDQDYAQRSAYYLITDSLVRATDARMDVLGLAARRPSSEDEALYDLSLAYERGAVLVYHFYNQMKAFEAVGVNIRDYFGDLLKNIDFAREEKRLDEYAQRLTRVKQLRTEARKYPEAKTLLEAALQERPNNARVLFGLADVASKQASTMNEGDPIEETLYAAVEYYKRAAQHASPETEKWLMQRSYVAAARILDFIAEVNPATADKVMADATAAYELALKLGKVEGGAYDEAEKAIKQRGQKPPQ